ncbi:NAD-P-binding protein [Trametes cingulata]|nr:NAD-P-binding protein [Trametes cingulata]
MSDSKIVVLVTGCSKGGIGFALCEEFASRGCIVYATARRVEAMEGFKHDNIHTLALDVTKDENVQEVVKTIIAREGQIDVLVNNAGVGNSGPILDIPMQEIMDVYDTNVYSIIRTSKAVIPHMAARKRGTIVNIGSIAGEIPVPWGGIYASTKAAVHSLTDTLYMECKPFNISVVLIAPGGVRSNIATNQAPRVHAHLPSPSPSSPSSSNSSGLYAEYVDSILAKLYMSQGKSAMPAETFAKRVVGEVLKRRPKRYMTLAAMSGIYRVLRWFPRTWVLDLFWWRLGEGPRVAALKKRKE